MKRHSHVVQQQTKLCVCHPNIKDKDWKKQAWSRSYEGYHAVNTKLLSATTHLAQAVKAGLFCVCSTGRSANLDLSRVG